MAILQLVLALLLQSIGRVLNRIFGWATITLFGKMAERQQALVSALSLSSAVWLIIVLGIAFPRIGTFLLTFIPLPEGMPTGWIRLVMLAAALVVPMGIGLSARLLLPKRKRPTGTDALRFALKGYPYALGLALSLVIMVVLVPVMKLQDAVRRWRGAHMPLLVEPEHYLEVVADVRRILGSGGYDTVQLPAHWMLRLPTRVLGFFGRVTALNLVAHNLTQLQAPGLEVLLYPFDLVIRGTRLHVARVQTILSEHLVFTRARLTFDPAAHQLEDRLASLWQKLDEMADENAWQELEEIRKAIERTPLTYEEWEALYRERVTIERKLLHHQHRAAAPAEASVTNG